MTGYAEGLGLLSIRRQA